MSVKLIGVLPDRDEVLSWTPQSSEWRFSIERGVKCRTRLRPCLGLKEMAVDLTSLGSKLVYRLNVVNPNPGSIDFPFCFPEG